MKSLFKRTLAMASGSVLALTQLAAVAGTVNISAADATTAAGSALNVDKAFLLYVPIDKADPLKAMSSNWSDKVESALLSQGNKTVKLNPENVKSRVRKYLSTGSFCNDEEIEEILAKIKEGDATVKTDGSVEAVYQFEEMGDLIGKIAERKVQEYLDIDFDGEGHALIDPDWSNYKVNGKLVINAKQDFASKKVTYTTAFYDEKNNEIKTAKGYDDYLAGKALEAATIIRDAAINSGDKDESKLTKADDLVETFKGQLPLAETLVGQFQDIHAQSDTLDGIYKAYDEQAIALVKASDLGGKRGDDAADKADKAIPETISEGFSKQKFQDVYTSGVNFFNKAYAGKVQISVTPEELYALANSAVTATYTVPNGYSMDAVMTLVDDQADEICKALIATGKTAKDINAAGYTVVLDKKDGTVVTDFTKEYDIIGVYSEKKLTANFDTEYGLKGTLFFDVERTVKQVIVQEKKVTETTPAVTTTAPNDGTTTGPKDGTTTAPNDGTTTAPNDGTTTAPNDGTTTAPKDGTTTGPKDGTTTTVTTTTDSASTTTKAPEEQFKVEGIQQNGLIYWSEETSTIDLSKLSVALRVYDENGKVTDKTVDLTDAFTATASKISELEMPKDTGIVVTPVYLKLTDLNLAQKKLALAGVDAEKAGIFAGMEAGRFNVFLVHRGDTDLNGSITAEDAQFALLYYTETMVSNNKAKSAFTETKYLANKGDKKEEYFPFAHYASDAFNGDGVITVEDAQTILKYYTENTVTGNNVAWTSNDVAALDTNPLDVLHAEPFARDDKAADYASVGFNAELADNK